MRNVGEGRGAAAGLDILLVTLVLVAVPRAANAYIDPSAGSILLQLLLGGVAGLFVVVKLGYRRLLEAFGIRRRPLQPTQEDSGSDLDR